MGESKEQRLRRLMGEAAALPPGSPRRRAVEAEIAQAGAWAEEEWLAILTADEQMRIALRRVPAPSGLEDRLLTITDTVPRRRRMFLRRPLLVAAAIVLTTFGAAALGHVIGKRRLFDRLETIALLAMSNHLNTQELTVRTSDSSVIQTRLGAGVPFEIKVPRLGEGFRLVGGRKCRLGAQPVIYTRWEKSGREYSVYQFCPKLFQLPAAFPRRVIVPAGVAAGGRPCEVLLWAENGCAYALVTERDAAATLSGPGVATSHWNDRMVFDRT